MSEERGKQSLGLLGAAIIGAAIGRLAIRGLAVEKAGSNRLKLAN
jgi:hypothetical protein